MCKKILSALLSLCMICTFLAVTVSAADSVVFRVNAPDSVAVGKTFTVTVSISEVVEGRGLTAKLNYDKEVLEFVSASGENDVTVHHNTTAGRVNAFLEKTFPADFSGTLMTVEFKAKAICEETALTLTECIATYGQGSDLAEYPASVENATVAVTARLLGDVNCDGRVTATDYSRLLAHVKKVNPLTVEEDLWAADVNGDGKVTATDYSRLLAHVKKVIL